ncbi:hypothetical protein MSP8887_00549 [Marinomonas spartinae]|uniref:hypothetical protein n=1 Tax=Marinomonas spartinae TaxID=1792290 RepID=UPI000808F377|nr:hypothetical protein [Marinomonas spartinae]SBS27141.1 hypothetical protein MSP8887_00549 [Marinomonas spartinae]
MNQASDSQSRSDFWLEQVKAADESGLSGANRASIIRSLCIGDRSVRNSRPQRHKTKRPVLLK